MDDWAPISLSQLSHAGFCLRRAALLANERVWSENADTAKGRSEHERVHAQRVERRGNSAKLYEFPVFSQVLGIAGKCDCIEAEASSNGCHVPALNFPVKLYPVEYKHGKLRSEREYELQLCAQAMCLEVQSSTSRLTSGTLFPSHRSCGAWYWKPYKKSSPFAAVSRFLLQNTEQSAEPVPSRRSVCPMCGDTPQVTAHSSAKRLWRRMLYEKAAGNAVYYDPGKLSV